MREANWGESRAGLAGAEDMGRISSGPDGENEENLTQELCGPNLSHTGGSLLDFSCCLLFTCGRSPKNGMGNVLWLPSVGLVSCSRSKELDLVPQLYAIFRFMADILVEVVLLILVPTGPVHFDLAGFPKLSPLVDLVHHMYCHGDRGSVLMEPSLGHDMSLIEEFCPLMYFSASECFWDIPLNCTKYEVTFFEDFALRNTAEKALDNYLNESIISGISLRYHCRAVPARVELLLEVVQFVTVVCLELWWSFDRVIFSASTTTDPCSFKVVEYRGPAPVEYHRTFSVLISINLPRATTSVETDSSRSARVRDQITLGALELSKGVGKYPKGLHQVLDVPGEDLRLCGFLQCSCTTPAWGLPSASRTGMQVVWRASERKTWMIGKWLLERHNALIPCAVVLRLVSCKREASRSEGDTRWVCAKGTLMLNQVVEGCTKIGTRTGTVTGTGCQVSGGVEQWVWHALPQYRCQPVRDGVAGAEWAYHYEKDLVIVREILLGSIPRNSMVICSRFSKERQKSLLNLTCLFPWWIGGLQRGNDYTINIVFGFSLGVLKFSRALETKISEVRLMSRRSMNSSRSRDEHLGCRPSMSGEG
ncbi:hypothetical protein TIFTF001_029323 [Ficus carica]|uniref:Uncharacterized protein n=1 Tax=Ficus carica TaxID=3494 RepID=A0AA88J2Q0_FICCA|nr:hypothetical protein TIFTF001_029323 [Ficus carica]